MTNIHLIGLVTIVGVLCLNSLYRLYMRSHISHRVFTILSFTGIISFCIQILLLNQLSIPQLESVMFLTFNGLGCWVTITALAWIAFMLSSIFTQRQLIISETFAALTLVGQVTYPLFIFGIWLGQG